MLDDEGFFHTSINTSNLKEYVETNYESITANENQLLKRKNMFSKLIDLNLNNQQIFINNRIQTSNQLKELFKDIRIASKLTLKSKYQNLFIKIDCNIQSSANNFVFNGYNDNFLIDALNNTDDLNVDYLNVINKFKKIASFEPNEKSIEEADKKRKRKYLGSSVYQYINKIELQKLFKHNKKINTFRLSFLNYLKANKNVGKDVLLAWGNCIKSAISSRHEKHARSQKIGIDYKIDLINNLSKKGAEMAEALIIKTIGINNESQDDDRIANQRMGNFKFVYIII